MVCLDTLFKSAVIIGYSGEPFENLHLITFNYIKFLTFTFTLTVLVKVVLEGCHRYFFGVKVKVILGQI